MALPSLDQTTPHPVDEHSSQHPKPIRSIARLLGCTLVGAVAVVLLTSAPGAADPLPDAKQIEAGSNHTCALLTNNGRVNCWGYNFDGQLGDGTTQTNTAVAVKAVGGVGQLTGAKELAAGTAHTCALLTNGRVNCWGDNHFGQLGDGTNTDSNTPVAVRAVNGGGELTGVKQISSKGAYTCALLTDGRVNCWGANFSGALGDGTTLNRSAQVVVQAVGGGGELSNVA
ncbi:MAG: RCC1 domain-containing protein, partial [Acidimicrobiales bacterium]